jgi:hypothetical protein
MSSTRVACGHIRYGTGDRLALGVGETVKAAPVDK